MFSRRTLLKLAASAGPLWALGCGNEDEAEIDPEAVPESTTRFPRTPMAGDVTANRAVLAFHVADDSPVVLRVWTADAVFLDEEVKPSGTGFHKVAVDGLKAGTDYQYAVFGADFEDRGLIARFRTAPADDDSPVIRLALLSCVGQGTILPDYYFPPESTAPTPEPFQWELFTHAADHDLDGLVHLGDQGYLDYVWNDAGATKEAYYEGWGFYHGGGYRDVYPLAALYATWDDHEVADNAYFDPWNVDDETAAKIANAQEVWHDVIPIDPEATTVWRSFRFGGTVELILLDCRYELGPNQIVSEDQLAWLEDRIASSPCRFVCVATPKPFAKITSDPPLAADNQDRWEAYPDQRARIEALRDERVLFVTGDIHMNYLGSLTADGDGWEVCCTSGNTNPLASGLSPDQFPFVDRNPHFPVLTFDPDAGTVHVAFHAVDGTLAFEQTLSM